MKQSLALIGPIFSMSGYGQHCRLTAKALIALDKFNLQIIPTQWGTTPQTALGSNDPISKFINPNLTAQPDISIQVSLPSEFQRIGKTSIGISAITEVNVVPVDFLVGTSNVDVVLVPSEFNKKILLETVVERKDSRTHETVQTIKCDKPVEVLFEGVDTSVFDRNVVVQSDLSVTLDMIPEQFGFLFVGHFLQARFKEDRKDVSGLIHTFLNTFKNKKNRPCLILKTSGAGFSVTERVDVTERIQHIQDMIKDAGWNGTLPNIYVLNGELSDDQMNELYNHSKVKSFVTFTKGESWGIPIADFTTTGKPVICSNYSGPLDYLHPEYSVLLPGSLRQIDESASNKFLPREGSWFSVNYNLAGQLMNNVFEKYDNYLTKSRKHIQHTKQNFSLIKMTEKLDQLIGQYSPKKMTLKLPPLKKLTDV